MKRWIGRIAFALALWYSIFGFSVPVLHARTTGIHLEVSMMAVPVPQGGAAPVGLPNGTAHQAVISWTASAPVSGVTVAGYNVYRATSAGGEAGTSAINGTTLVTSATFTDTSVTSGTKYFYVVAAQSTTGNQSAFSNESSGTVPSNPTNPTGCNTATQ